jgi:phosphatidylglycerol---prolipoprotein diacylglyceryl transferase
MFPVLQIGSIALPTAPLTLMLGVWIGAWLAKREATRLGLSGDSIAALLMVGLVAGLIAARLGYVARHFGSYRAEPLGMFSPNPATLALGPGLLGGLIAMLLDGRRRTLPLWRTLDALAPGLATLGVASGVANLASGTAFGAPAQLPWSITLWEQPRHPSQAYEIVGALAILGIWRLSRAGSPFDGFSFVLVVALSAAARVFLEAFRGDSWIIASGLHGAQLVGLTILALCLAALPRLASRAHVPDRASSETDLADAVRQETA